MGEDSSATAKTDSPSGEPDATASESEKATEGEARAEREPSAATDTASAPSAETAPAEGEAKPKKKKRRKKAEPAPVERDPLGPDGRERPAFVLDYPSDPELDRLVKAFELGNYAFVREHAPALAKKSENERVRAAAGELARRIEPDPLIKALLGMSLALFVVLALWAYKTHGN